MQVEGQHARSSLRAMATGARVSHTCATCPPPGDNFRKRKLTPDAAEEAHASPAKTTVVADGHAGH